MQVVFTKIFEKEIRKITNKNLAGHIEEAIIEVKSATKLYEINHLKKLTGYKNAYRIKIGDYRIGILIIGKTVEFSRFLHRREIYKYFP